MEKPILDNPEQFPTDDIIFSVIGSSKNLWKSIFDYIQNEHPDFIKEWRFYKDGKSWLMKVIRKKKTICWVSVIPDAFRMTFYFADKAEPMIMESAISDELKENFKGGKHYGKIRGLTIVFDNEKDIEYAKALMTIKLKLK